MIKKAIRKIIKALSLLSLILLLITCSHSPNVNNFQDNNQFDGNGLMNLIKLRGKIIAITNYNSTDYFIYRGEKMGYQYDLLNSFADYLGVKLEIIIDNEPDKAIKDLNDGICDLIAMDIRITRERIAQVDFSNPMNQIRQVLVQQKPRNWRKMSTWDEVESHLIRNPLELAGKTIYIPSNSSYRMRLKNLSEEIGDTISVIVEKGKTMEELIDMVESGQIQYTIADEPVALISQSFYPDIDVVTAISFSQNTAWAVRKGSNDLLIEINKWLEGFKRSKEATLTYNKYFKNPWIGRANIEDYHRLKRGGISDYDEFIKLQSNILGWDWRLLASLIFQESGFDQNTRSWAGAYGMMQLMPATAKKFGVDSLSSPQANIEAGVKFLKYLDDQFEDIVTDENERHKFVLASYNVGIAHVYDAMRLAEKYNKDPAVWTNNVDSFMLFKSNPQYYSDSVVYYGYARGSETYNFVNKVLEKFNQYKTINN
jgi:membrane-bound lytic murein transglycosylase F